MCVCVCVWSGGEVGGEKGDQGDLPLSLAAAAGDRAGGGGERRRRPLPAHHSLHLISGRCALRKARASGSRRRREAGSCCSHRRRHHVLPRQEEHPAHHGESDATPARSLAPGCSAGAWIPPASPGQSPGRDGDPGSEGVESGGQSSRRGGAPPRRSDPGVWGKPNKEETQTVTVAWRTLGYFSSLPNARQFPNNRPSVDPRATGVVRVSCPR